MFYWFLKRVVLGPVLRLIFRPYVIGAENVPAEGGAIFASNHLSFSDSIFLPLVVERRITFLAKADYFTGSGLQGLADGGLPPGVGQLPVDRSGGPRGLGGRHCAPDCGSCAAASAWASTRRTCSPDGRLYRGKTGVARMALEAEVPGAPRRHDRHREDPAARLERPTLGIRVGIENRALRSTSPATRAWRATGSSSARSPTRSCTS